MPKIAIIIVISLILFSPSLNTFFYADDWFHLRISQISTLNDFFAFFSFAKNDFSASFYRPLSTQVFFFIFQKFFDLNTIYYHIFVLIVFGLVIFLIFNFIKEITNYHIGLLSSFIYGISSTNFTKLYFLSAFQELFLVFFALLSLISYIKFKNIFLSIIFFVLALLSKETAVTIPFLLLFLEFFFLKKNIKKIMPFVLILLVYIYFRVTYFGFVGGDSYTWNFSIFRLLNTLAWYVLWSFGTPEFLIDYISSGFRVIPSFFASFGSIGLVLICIILLNLTLFLATCLKNLKILLNKQLFFSLIFFMLTISPVIFLPFHKFIIELTLPMVGFALFLSYLIINTKNLSAWIFLGLFVTLNIYSNLLTIKTHYTINGGKLSQEVYRYIKTNFPEKPKMGIGFINGMESDKKWGVSKQIANVVSSSEMFKVIYNDPNYWVFFEDLGQIPNTNMIIIDSSIFFK